MQCYSCSLSRSKSLFSLGSAAMPGPLHWDSCGYACMLQCLRYMKVLTTGLYDRNWDDSDALYDQ